VQVYLTLSETARRAVRETVKLAARYAVPAMHKWRKSVVAGGLVSYGASLTGMWRQVGTYARKDPKGRAAGGSPGSATNDIRAGDQPEDRDDA